MRHFYDRGVRYITLTHSEDNHICDSSYSEKRTWKGLSPFGRELVAGGCGAGLADRHHAVFEAVSHVGDRCLLELRRHALDAVGHPKDHIDGIGVIFYPKPVPGI